MNQTTLSHHHHHPDISFPSSGKNNKYQLEHYYNTIQTKHSMDVPLDASIEVSNSRVTATMMTGSSSSAYGNSNGSFYINSNEDVINGPSNNLLNHSQVTSSTTPTNAEGYISPWNGDSLEALLFGHAVHNATTTNGSATKEGVPQSPLQTMENFSHASQAYNDNRPIHDETNEHVTLKQQQQTSEQNDPMFGICSPVCIYIYFFCHTKSTQ